MNKFLKSILCIALVSLVLTFCLYPFFPQTIWTIISLFVFFSVIQIVSYYLVTLSIDAYTQVTLKKIEVEQLKLYSKITYAVACPCAIKNVEHQPIDISGENFYICNKCQKDISIRIGVETALKTSPTPDVNLNKLLDKIKPIIDKENENPSRLDE